MELKRVVEIDVTFRRYMDALEDLHKIVFKKGNKTLYWHPWFKGLVYDKEIIVKRSLKFRNKLDKLKGV